jgi:hypothetical protein
LAIIPHPMTSNDSTPYQRASKACTPALRPGVQI